VPRANRQTLDKRERRFVKGVVEGKSRIQAAKDAGYATSTAEKKSYAILQRPLGKSALTEAMRKIGMTHELMVQPLKDALTAMRSYFDPKCGLLVETQVPDHKMCLEASRVAVAIFGGIPKVGESTPTAHGLNLFIAVDPGTRNEELPSSTPNAVNPHAGTVNATSGPPSVPRSGPLQAPAKSAGVRLGIQEQNSLQNRRAVLP
jgi:hypothetical protein